jgi:cytochrome P450
VSSVAERPASAEEPAFPDLVGEAAPSPAGPIEPALAAELPKPPVVPLPRAAQMLRFTQRQIEYVFGARRRIGETFRMRTAMPGGPVVTSHPDHVRSLFTAKPELAPSLTGESPLRPILGTGSVLTSLGDRHMRQRKLLLPPFHGEAIERYTTMITAATERELDRWPLNQPFALAPRMQAITLDVIMAGIFGIEGKPERGTPEDRMRSTVKLLVNASTSLVGQAGELLNIGREDAVRRAPRRAKR